MVGSPGVVSKGRIWTLNMTRWGWLCVAVAAWDCGGKVDVCTRADEYFSKCTGRHLSDTCRDDVTWRCIAQCIVELEPDCSEFMRRLDPNGPISTAEFTHCVADCRSAAGIRDAGPADAKSAGDGP
jgi:hypothetical protein